MGIVVDRRTLWCPRRRHIDQRHPTQISTESLGNVLPKNKAISGMRNIASIHQAGSKNHQSGGHEWIRIDAVGTI